MNDVNPHESSENGTKGIIFGIAGGTFAGLAALFAISMLLKHRPDTRSKTAPRVKGSLQARAETTAAGVSSVELL